MEDIKTVRTLAHNVYDAINAQDMAALEGLFAPGIIRHATGEVGFEKARKAVMETFAKDPEKHFVIEDLLVDGNKAALRVTVQGAPASEGTPLPTILEIFHFKDNKVVEIWGAGTVPVSR